MCRGIPLLNPEKGMKRGEGGRGVVELVNVWNVYGSFVLPEQISGKVKTLPETQETWVQP